MSRMAAVVALVVLVAAGGAWGQGADLGTRLMLSTVLVSNTDSVGTAFLLTRPAPDQPEQTQVVLVTADHVLSRVKGDTVTVLYHRQAADGGYEKLPTPLQVRRDGHDLWTKHPGADVAVMRITPPAEAVPPCVSAQLLAGEADLLRWQVHPGDTIRCLGFPHPVQFEPGPGGFGLVRMGCIASFPLTPVDKLRTFLADLNVFEGDSGSAVYLAEDERRAEGQAETGPVELILGLVVAQQFLDERYNLIYGSGLMRHRMGLATVVNAASVREALELMGKAA